jgi:glycosyltransferase involved in cell wall biosynthesis
MSSRPLVSVIMPVYNERPEYLNLAVESILNQTYSPFEFLIMDDGSSPEGAAALGAVAQRDGRIRLIRQENAGLTVSLNRLIRQAQGAFIARQDSDDISEPERLQRQVALFEVHPKMMLLGTDCLIIDSKGSVLLRQGVETRPQVLKRLLRRTNQFAHGSVMFRATIFRDEMNFCHAGCPAFGYHETFQYAQDYDLFLRISEHFEIANLDKPLYRCRINPDSISVAKSRDQLFMGMVVRAAARLRRNGQSLRWSQETYDRIAASLNTPRHQRLLECLVCAGQGRNLLLAGKKQEARQAFWRAFSLRPSPRRLWHLLRSLGPGRGVQ